MNPGKGVEREKIDQFTREQLEGIPERELKVITLSHLPTQRVYQNPGKGVERAYIVMTSLY